MGLRKLLVVAGMAAAVVGTGATSAYALDCANVSRPAPVQPAAPVLAGGTGFPTIWVVQGNWWFISFGSGGFSTGFWDFVPPGTAATVIGMTADEAAALGLPTSATAGNYQAGQGFGLLDKAQAPCVTVRQTTHGIQAESMRCGQSS
jgi:hypothetical protein